MKAFSALRKMSPTTRRVVQALLYEPIAIAAVGPLLSLVFDKAPASAQTGSAA